MANVTLIDQDAARREPLAADLRNQGLTVSTFDALASANTASCDVLIVTDQALENQASACETMPPVIVLAEDPSIKASVSLLQAGAKDYLSLPVKLRDLMASVERITAKPLRPRNQNTRVEMIGSSEIMKTLRQRIAKVGPTDSSVLILGQSGTGKELVAKGIHAVSRRSHTPLITLNCATVPTDLIEAELFGVQPYDSSQKAGRGLVEAADGGTLFLDEIAELSAAAQARLLQVVQGENRRVGSAESTPVDVRIIAATHRDLKVLTEGGDFRSDLYYRLNVICFELSPLRNRHQDIIEIGERLLDETCRRLDKPGLALGKQARQAMLSYHWPGNVRELSNAIERAVILADEGSEITQALLAIEPTKQETLAEVAKADPSQTSLEDYFVRFVQENEEFLTETELAERLGISRKSLWERRQRLQIPRRKTRKRGSRTDS